ncbi:hypothetical protein C8P66_11274 [Humitalea rosea]|uniref:J domain-containing protein n=1 Tax=Humitalea rosea TaxID=990373 RepID=A0A2W7IEH8_9PROT|nr:molecular chaperone DnaJ [Humitalea rosea]PZW45058.1 hypothetical protein C8P66_11274 [Humitalea rosea]
MGALALGALALLGVALLLRGFASAPIAAIKRAAAWSLGIIGVLLVALLLVTGRGGQAIGALIFFGPLLWRSWNSWQARRRFAAGGGDTTSVDTATLAMRLDHATGTMAGEVTRGPQAGRSLAELGQEELLALLTECRTADPDSVPLLEAWADRAFPGWREHTAPGEEAMDRADALAVLGLEESAGPAEIKAAHRRLMATAHPDRGGSDWLAARINRARDLLLRD